MIILCVLFRKYSFVPKRPLVLFFFSSITQHKLLKQSGTTHDFLEVNVSELLLLVEKTSLLVGPVMYLYIYLFIYLCMYVLSLEHLPCLHFLFVSVGKKVLEQSK